MALDPLGIFLEIDEDINMAHFFPIFRPSLIEEFKPINELSPIINFLQR